MQVNEFPAEQLEHFNSLLLGDCATWIAWWWKEFDALRPNLPELPSPSQQAGYLSSSSGNRLPRTEGNRAVLQLSGFWEAPPFGHSCSMGHPYYLYQSGMYPFFWQYHFVVPNQGTLCLCRWQWTLGTPTHRSRIIQPNPKHNKQKPPFKSVLLNVCKTLELRLQNVRWFKKIIGCAAVELIHR